MRQGCKASLNTVRSYFTFTKHLAGRLGRLRPASEEVSAVRTRTIIIRSSVAAVLILAAACSDPDEAGGDEEPIVVGSTLPLTGAFAATGVIHQIAGEQFVEQLNANGGLLGRPVEWRLLDDESDQAQVTQLYERLINQDEVDLIIGPYATPNIIAAVAVAERAGYVIPQHTAVLAPLLTYECQFPGWSIGPTPDVYVPEQLFEALASLPDPPTRLALVTNESGSAGFMTNGLAEADTGGGMRAIAPEHGLEIAADLPYPPGNQEWGSIAAQLRDADPDLVINNGLGVDPVGLIEAMEQLDYRPPMFFSLFPAPGPLLGLGEPAEGALSVSIFEPNEPVLAQYGDEVRGIVDEFAQRATDAGVAYTAFETQATASWNTWETLAGGVEGADSLDQQVLCDHLRDNGVETTFSGHLTFDPAVSNFWPSNQGLKQIQDGEWVMVWPAERAAAPIQPPAAG
ncbi:MAG: ABC transporter substrate-binding protein [Micromonosporaceae bacterium]|nr:ABC transporter substrate-binding protein [Micromonosporaceae bacterium]